MTSFSIDEDNNLVAEITGAFKEVLIPVVEYIAVHNKLSSAFKDYLIRICNKSITHSLQKPLDDLEYSSLQIDADSIRNILKFCTYPDNSLLESTLQ